MCATLSKSWTAVGLQAYFQVQEQRKGVFPPLPVPSTWTHSWSMAAALIKVSTQLFCPSATQLVGILLPFLLKG